MSKNEHGDILNKFSDNLNIVRGFSVFFVPGGRNQKFELIERGPKRLS